MQNTDIAGLVAQLQSKINPAYENMQGTESFERRLCVDAIQAQSAEIRRLRGIIEQARCFLGQEEACQGLSNV